MRLHRLKLVNFRGVADREVEFADSGVTVIEGDNEAGKSSMVEALDLLLTTRDKSSKASVRAVQPSGQDVGSEVTAEISCGPWRFTYFKRFNKLPETALTITEPVAEQLTGRAAHERVEQILNESLDRTLYRALSLVQSSDPELGALTDSSALSRALDRVAATLDEADASADVSGESPQTQDLLAAVEAEYKRYYTAAQGRPTGVLLAAQQALAQATARAHEREQVLAGVSAASDALPDVAAEIAVLVSQESEQRVELSELAAEVAQAEALADRLRTAQATHGQRLLVVDAAQSAVRERTGLRQRLAQNESEAALTAENVATALAAAAAATERADAGEQDLATVRADLASAAAALDAAEGAEAVAADRRRLSDLDATLAAVANLQAQLAEAKRRAADLTVTTADEKAASVLDREIAAATARVESARVSVVVTPLGGRVSIDGESIDGERTIAAAGPTVIESDSMIVSVTPGADAQLLAADLDRLTAEAEALAARCGVSAIGEIAAAAQAAAQAHSAVQELTAELRRELGASTLDDLTAERGLLAARIPEGVGVAPGDVRELRARERAAVSAVAAAERAVSAERQIAVQETQRAQSWDTAGERAKNGAASLREELLRVSAEMSDSALAAAAVVAQAELDESSATVNRLAGEVSRFDADRLRVRHEEASALLDRTRSRLAERRTKQTELSTILEVCRTDGRLDELDDAVAEQAAAQREFDRVSERAAGARVLHETLQRKRAESRARYVDPFTRRLEELAEPVFGAGVRFAVADDFSVQARTLDGVTVDANALSGGAREQVGLLARLACASLVDEADGVPVILDDALGYTDPTRLAAMAAVLGRAGGDAQIIVLTCTPDRYRGVPDASLVAV